MGRRMGLISLIVLFLLLIGVDCVYAEEAKIDTGDTAWLIVATAFVMLMTFPGLALFYGGITKKGSVLNTIAMVIVTYGIVSVLWVIYGYSLAFCGDVKGIIGTLSNLFLKNITLESVSGTIPEYIFVAFQLTFAAITVALITGALVERMKFSAWLVFCVLWFTLVYVPIAHWVWGGGFLSEKGIVDFAGGLVVHISSGIAALVACLLLGKRKEPKLIPNNLVITVIGTGLLWFGWFGFNAGSALASNSLATLAFLNTNTATALAALSWAFTEWITTRKFGVLGFCTGAIAGLVAITPAAGFVNIKGAMVIGILAGIVCYFMVSSVKAKLGYDDALDVMGVHGGGGILGSILTGIFADPKVGGVAGLFYGNPKLLLNQILGVIVVVIYVAIVTAIIFGIIKAIMPVRASEREEMAGLDIPYHGERAYDIVE